MRVEEVLRLHHLSAVRVSADKGERIFLSRKGDPYKVWRLALHRVGDDEWRIEHAPCEELRRVVRNGSHPPPRRVGELPVIGRPAALDVIAERLVSPEISWVLTERGLERIASRLAQFGAYSKLHPELGALIGGPIVFSARLGGTELAIPSGAEVTPAIAELAESVFAVPRGVLKVLPETRPPAAPSRRPSLSRRALFSPPSVRHVRFQTCARRMTRLPALPRSDLYRRPKPLRGHPLSWLDLYDLRCLTLRIFGGAEPEVTELDEFETDVMGLPPSRVDTVKPKGKGEAGWFIHAATSVGIDSARARCALTALVEWDDSEPIVSWEEEGEDCGLTLGSPADVPRGLQPSQAFCWVTEPTKALRRWSRPKAR